MTMKSLKLSRTVPKQPKTLSNNELQKENERLEAKVDTLKQENMALGRTVDSILTDVLPSLFG